MNRSIEGDSSICVWVAPTEFQMHFMSLLLECLVTTHWGQVTSSFGVMSLRANVNFMTEILLLYFILGLLYIRLKLHIDGFYKPYYWSITELWCFASTLLLNYDAFASTLLKIFPLDWFIIWPHGLNYLYSHLAIFILEFGYKYYLCSRKHTTFGSGS